MVALEDCPLFNAGRGAVFTHDGHNELDAAIMNGATLAAGAVCGLTHIANPIVLARRVMEKSDYVMLSGAGAEEFAKLQGFEFVAPDYFYTEARWNQLQRILEGDNALSPLTISHTGTVGAVALDSHGNLAAATSTGGMTGKRFNRIGDSPADRRRYLRRQSVLCGVSNRTRREIHLRRRRPRHRGTNALRGA